VAGEPLLHRCLAPGCITLIPPERIACRYHLEQLPPELRESLERAWARGQTATVAYRTDVTRATAVWRAGGRSWG
jgi:hypothetical protein